MLDIDKMDYLSVKTCLILRLLLKTFFKLFEAKIYYRFTNIEMFVHLVFYFDEEC
jgi:hypothetical protein